MTCMHVLTRCCLHIREGWRGHAYRVINEQGRRQDSRKGGGGGGGGKKSIKRARRSIARNFVTGSHGLRGVTLAPKKDQWSVCV